MQVKIKRVDAPRAIIEKSERVIDNVVEVYDSTHSRENFKYVNYMRWQISLEIGETIPMPQNGMLLVKFMFHDEATHSLISLDRHEYEVV